MKHLLLVCFFISGACGLIYEIAWLRSMGLIFGNTTFAISAVLAGYMAGLGLGALWWGKRIDRHGEPVKTYARLEAGIGIYALATPLIWVLIDLFTVGFYRFISPSFFLALIFKLLVSFLALLFPTFLMGATLPILSKYFVCDGKKVAKQVGLLYGLNTFGAVTGVLFSGFFAIPVFGVRETVYGTAALNFIVFFLCSYFRGPVDHAGSVAPKENHLPVPTAGTFSPFVTRGLLTAFAVSGAVSMMYEVSWTRVLSVAMGSSVYAFSIMLATFLLGISLGSYLFGLVAEKIPVRLFTFSFFQLLTALTAVLGINFFNDMPYYFFRVYAYSRGSELIFNLGKFALCSSVMLGPTVAIGAMFACFIHVIKQSKPIGQEIGVAYFANTIGTIAGSVLAGFVIIPLIGTQNTILLAALLNAVIGVSSLFPVRFSLKWKQALSAALLVILIITGASSVRAWDRGFLTSGLAILPDWAVGKTRNQILETVSQRELVFYKEGLSSTVSVHRLKDASWLSVNGKADASSDPRDNVTQALLGYIPMTLHPAPRKVMIIGLGSGSTASAVAAYPVRQIDLVEIEKAVVEASSFFKTLNRNVLADPRLKIHINDGRNFALLTPETYDVIISEPSNPWMAGVGNLFSLEHYQTLRKRLAPGGIVCQWVPVYRLSSEDFRMIVKTFSDVFPETSLWTPGLGDLFLIGKKEPLTLDMKNIERAFQIPQVRNELQSFGIQTAEGFFSNALLFRHGAALLTQNAKVNSDDHPYLEFSAPKDLYRPTVSENVNLIQSAREFDAFPEIKNLEPPPGKNVLFWNALARGYLHKQYDSLASVALAKAIAVDPDNAETLLLMGRVSYSSGAPEKALTFLNLSNGLRPDHAETNYYLGKVSQDMGDPYKAVPFFGKAVKQDPDNPLYLTAWANALSETKQYASALMILTKALALKPEDNANWREKMMLTLLVGTLKDIEDVYREVTRRYPRLLSHYRFYGEQLYLNGKFTEALQVYSKMILLSPTSGTSYLDAAKASWKLGDEKKAKKYLQKAIHYNPELAKDPETQKMFQPQDKRS